MDQSPFPALDPEPPSSYTGRWVARLRGTIIAQGNTRDEALLAAKASHPKEIPEIVFMSTSSPYTLPLLDAVLSALPGDQPIYLVGGAVRDLLLARNVHDLDFTVPAGAIPLARKLAAILGAAFYVLDHVNDTARVILTAPDGTRDVLDFASFRATDLEADLFARDFTINAIALDPRQKTLIDPTGGALDLREKRLRACSQTSLCDDPVRILRAVRQAIAFDLHLEPDTARLIREALPLLPKISNERVRDELFKILDGPSPGTAMRILDTLGVLPYILPEAPALKGVKQTAPHIYDVWEHTLRVLDYLEAILSTLAPGYDADTTNDLFTGMLTLRLGRFREQFGSHYARPAEVERSPRSILFFAALYHDIGKPLTVKIEGQRIRFFGHEERGVEIARKRGEILRLSNEEIERVSKIIAHHMRIHFHAEKLLSENMQPTRRAIYRFFRDAGSAGPDLCLLALADRRGTDGYDLQPDKWQASLDVCRNLLENYWERPAEVVAPPQLLNGNELMDALGIKPGPQLGQLIESIREAQAMGEISAREEALSFARGWLAARNAN